MTRLSFFLATAACSAALLCAQGPGQGRGRMGGAPNGTPPDPAQMVSMRVNMLTERLGLTDSQKAQATKIYTDLSTATQSLQSTQRSNQTSLREAIKKNDLASIEQLATAIGTLDGQLTSANAKAEAAFFAILTADQQSEYDSVMGPGGFGGPGGMMRGGPGMMGGRGGRAPRDQ